MLLGLGVLGAAIAPAWAGDHCPDEAPFAYVWGVVENGEGRSYYYTGVLRLTDETYADLVAEFALRARDQYGVRPAAKPSRCFASQGQAQADLQRLRANQHDRGVRQLDLHW